MALLSYFEWPSADPALRDLIPEAVDRHWKWFQEIFWKNGNAWSGLLDFPGWCGVANQDLVIVAALAKAAKVLGRRESFEAYGLPVLETYLSPRYYHEAIGLFERGDRPQFAERTPYYGVILEMLELLIADGIEPVRLQAVVDNVSGHLFDSVFTWKDDKAHFSWGTKMKEGVVVGWTHGPITFSAYPHLLPFMERHLARYPDASHQASYDRLKETLAAYVFQDGTIPSALGTDDSTFAVVANGDLIRFWTYLIDLLGDKVLSPERSKVVSVHRTCGGITWKDSGFFWSLERKSEALFAGFKPNPFGVTIGKEPPFYVERSNLDRPQALEVVETF